MKMICEHLAGKVLKANSTDATFDSSKAISVSGACNDFNSVNNNAVATAADAHFERSALNWFRQNLLSRYPVIPLWRSFAL